MERTPELLSALAWLREAAVDIAVTPSEMHDEWRVEVNNGLGGHSGVGSVIARCSHQHEAELVRAGLWALLEEAPPGMTFVEAVRAGKATEDDIDDWVERWHTSEQHRDLSLGDYLGLTREEFNDWVRDPAAIRMVLQLPPTGS